MKKIIIIRSNPVDPDSRVEKEAYSLIKGGYDVSLVVWDREHNHTSIDKKDILDVSLDRYRIGARSTYGEGVKNLKAFLIFQLCIAKFLIKNHSKYDYIHACDFDTAFTTSICALILRKKYVFDIFDYLATEPKTIFEKVVNNLEHWIINHAAATIICTEKRKEQIQGSKPKKLEIIHNSPAKIKFQHVELKSKSSKIRLVYVGVFQDYRLLKELIDAVAKMQNVELHIGGFGKLENYIKDFADKSNNIFYYGKLSYPETLSLESQADIMTAIYDPQIGNHKFAAPNKFYEALFLGKPLIMVKGTGMSQEVQDNDLGILIDYDENSFVNGVRALIDRKKDWSQISRRMKNLYNEKYSWEKMSTRLVSLYDHLN
jgi:glycosyltransferase involved in cell wall biosynthesis